MFSASLTVVLPVLNEAEHLGNILDQLKAQDAVPGGFEVVVVDGGSSDGTRELVEERAQSWEALRLFPNPKGRSAPARNIGALHARGRFVLYLDGHCLIPSNELLRRTVELFESTGADCLCRPQPLQESSRNAWGEAISRARHSCFGHNPDSDIFSVEAGFTKPETAGAAYRLNVIQDLNGYDERFDACEDVEFNHRVALAGYTAYKHPDLAVSYQPRGSLVHLFRQMKRYGRGRARLMARHPDMTPWLLVALTVLLALAVVVVPLLGWGLWARSIAVLSLVYALLCLGMSNSGTLSPVGRLQTAAVFPFIHGGLLAGFLRGLPETMYYKIPPGSSDSLSGMRRNAAASR